MLPEGFEERASANLLCWARRGLAQGAIDASDPGRGHEARGRVRFCALEGLPAGETVAVRHYFRGGLLAPLLRDFHLDARRPLREIELYLEARKAGVPTLEPLAGVSRRAAGPLWRCDLVTRAVPGARDLGDLWPELARGAPQRRARVTGAVARAVRALHDAGFHHRDLNLKNVLVDEGAGAGTGTGTGTGAADASEGGVRGACPDLQGEGPGATSAGRGAEPLFAGEVDRTLGRSATAGGREPPRQARGVRALIIDLDGASRRAGALERGAREENILRLYRSSQKLAGKHGTRPPGPRDLVRFARAYAGEDAALYEALTRLHLPGFRLRRLLWAGSAAAR